MTFNVLTGAEDRLARVLEVIREAAPDVLVLQECLGWEGGAELDALASALGVSRDRVALAEARPRGSGKRYHLAVAARAGVGDLRVHADPAFVGHAIARFDVDVGAARVHVVGAHFDAHSESLRFVEARTLRSLLAAEAPGHLLLLGDLNSLSRRDPYPADLGELLIRAGTHKYGHPPRFEVIDEIETMGLVDVLRLRPHAGPWVTARRDRGGIAIDYRTDYVFASPPLAERLVRCDVLPSRGASDHEPVLAVFDV